MQIIYNTGYFTEWGNSFWNNKVSFVELIKQLSAIFPHDSKLLNPPTWYVALEVRLFLIFPILVMISNTKYLGWWIFILLSLFSFTSFGDFYGVCAVGCLAKYICINWFNKLVWISKQRILYFFSLCIAIFLLNIPNEFSSMPHNIALGFQAYGAALLVLLFCVKTSKLLAGKVLVWLGDLSYEFYLTHFVVLLTLRSFYYDAFTYILSSLFLSLFISEIMKKVFSILYKK